MTNNAIQTSQSFVQYSNDFSTPSDNFEAFHLYERSVIVIVL